MSNQPLRDCRSGVPVYLRRIISIRGRGSDLCPRRPCDRLAGSCAFSHRKNFPGVRSKESKCWDHALPLDSGATGFVASQ
jgi:hypothetical protein